MRTDYEETEEGKTRVKGERKVKSYELSRDYTLLKKLLDDGMEIVCFSEYQCDEVILRDVCLARCRVKDKDYCVSSRGMEYSSWYDWYSENKPDFTFEKAMEKANIEFIPPTL